MQFMSDTCSCCARTLCISVQAPIVHAAFPSLQTTWTHSDTVNQSTDINPNSLLQLRFHEWLTVCVVVTRVHVAELFEVLDSAHVAAQMSVMVHCSCGCKHRKTSCFAFGVGVRALGSAGEQSICLGPVPVSSSTEGGNGMHLATRTVHSLPF
jgi:hypothetical protein